MNPHSAPDWPEAKQMLRDAVRRRQRSDQYRRLASKGNELAPGYTDRMVRNHLKGDEPLDESKISFYANWLYHVVNEPGEYVAEWLEYTGHPRPGELLAQLEMGQQLGAPGSGLRKLYDSVHKSEDLPELRNLLYGNFLGRTDEIAEAAKWADNTRFPVALLWGFGGNGKTTIQVKLADLFTYGRRCQLRWPFHHVVWVSAKGYSLGQPSLSVILREVIRVFGTQDGRLLERMPLEWLCKESRKLLRKSRTLILVDNFESISEGNQNNILTFLNSIGGKSQTLISSRHIPQISGERLWTIPVAGLDYDQSRQLINDILGTSRASDMITISDQEIDELIRKTRSNPKVIIAILKFALRGLNIHDILARLSSGSADDISNGIFSEVIGMALEEEILNRNDKAILLGKSFFKRPVSEVDLGKVAGVDGEELSQSIAKLRSVSLFDMRAPGDIRIDAHPLSHDFALQLIHSDEEVSFLRQAEERWWTEFAIPVADKTMVTTYGSFDKKLEDDLMNVLERLEVHVHSNTSYALRAAKLFSGNGGVGDSLQEFGKWDDVLRVANLVLEFGVQLGDPRIIGECALQLIVSSLRDLGRMAEVEHYVRRTIEINATINDDWLDGAIAKERASVLRTYGHFRAAKSLMLTEMQKRLEKNDYDDLAAIYMNLGGATLDAIMSEYRKAVHENSNSCTDIADSEEYFRLSEKYLPYAVSTHWVRNFGVVSISAWRGVIARFRGDFIEATRLLEGQIGRFRGMVADARLWYELALLEHCKGNKHLAYAYEDRARAIEQQLGIDMFKTTPHNVYLVIGDMKQAGLW